MTCIALHIFCTKQHRPETHCVCASARKMTWLPPIPNPSPFLSFSSVRYCLLFPVCSLNSTLLSSLHLCDWEEGARVMFVWSGVVSSGWLGLYLNLGRQSQTEGLFVAFDLAAHASTYELLSPTPHPPLHCCYYAFSAPNLPFPRLSLVQERLLPLYHLPE